MRTFKEKIAQILWQRDFEDSQANGAVETDMRYGWLPQTARDAYERVAERILQALPVGTLVCQDGVRLIEIDDGVKDVTGHIVRDERDGGGPPLSRLVPQGYRDAVYLNRTTVVERIARDWAGRAGQEGLEETRDRSDPPSIGQGDSEGQERHGNDQDGDQGQQGATQPDVYQPDDPSP